MALIFVYPLKMVFSALLAILSNGHLPTNFALTEAADLPRLFIIYGVGFAALTGLIALLYLRALRARERLALNELES